MNIEDLQAICMAFNGVTEDIKWENNLCFSVGKKIFMLIALDTVPPSASFKVTDEEFEELTGRDEFIPAPYFARNKWIHVADINRMNKAEWEFYARQSYQLVASRLPVKTQKHLGIYE
jgi:predicted DNA-binding protein (MmcQ/YjbR family)